MNFRERFSKTSTAAELVALIEQEESEHVALRDSLNAQKEKLAGALLSLSDEEIHGIQRDLREIEDAIELKTLRLTKLDAEHKKRQEAEEAAEVDRLLKQGRDLTEASVKRVVATLDPLFMKACDELQAFADACEEVRKIRVRLEQKGITQTGLKGPESALQQQHPRQMNSMGWVELLKDTRLPNPRGGAPLWPRKP